MHMRVLLVCRYIRLSISTCNVKRTAEDIRLAGGTVLRETTMRTLKGQDAPVRHCEILQSSKMRSASRSVVFWTLIVQGPKLLLLCL